MPPNKLRCVAFGATLQKKHFADGAPFDQLYAPWR